MTSQVVERTPLPFPQFFIVLCIRCIEPISFTLIFPFIYFMVKDFNVTDNPKEIAFYAGFVSSAFAIGEFLSGVPWGMLSDKIGRKPVIKLGLIGTMVTMFAFGLSKSLTWAIVTRFLSGALNGNIGVLKSMVGEMTDRTNRAVGFGYVAMSFGLGSILGPALGGFLTHPVTNFPTIFGGNKFLAEYPYFLPCFICCVFDLIGIICVHLYLEETLNRPVLQSNLEASTSLLDSDSTRYDGLEPQMKTSSITEFNTEEISSSISKPTWIAISSYISLSLLFVMLTELFPFWAATSIKYGGLSYLPSDIGLISSISGMTLVFIQLFLCPTLQQRFATLTLYRFAFILVVPVVSFLPIVSSLMKNGFTLSSWWVLVFLMGLRVLCDVLAFTSFNILLSESCESKHILGKVNGIAQALGSLMRGIGPSLCGALWSWSLNNGLNFPLDYHFTFYFISSLSIITYWLVTKINPETLIY